MKEMRRETAEWTLEERIKGKNERKPKIGSVVAFGSFTSQSLPNPT